MTKEKQPHETMIDKNNGLSSAQEVLYQQDFNRADKAADEENNQDNKNK